jgi:hypothetical protein
MKHLDKRYLLYCDTGGYVLNNINTTVDEYLTQYADATEEKIAELLKSESSDQNLKDALRIIQKRRLTIVPVDEQNIAVDGREAKSPIPNEIPTIINDVVKKIVFGVLGIALIIIVSIVFVSALKVDNEKIDKWFAAKNVKAMQRYVKHRSHNVNELHLYTLLKLVSLKDSLGYRLSDMILTSSNAELLDMPSIEQWKQGIVKMYIEHQHVPPSTQPIIDFLLEPSFLCDKQQYG